MIRTSLGCSCRWSECPLAGADGCKAGQNTNIARMQPTHQSCICFIDIELVNTKGPRQWERVGEKKEGKMWWGGGLGRIQYVFQNGNLRPFLVCIGSNHS